MVPGQNILQGSWLIASPTDLLILCAASESMNSTWQRADDVPWFFHSMTTMLNVDRGVQAFKPRVNVHKDIYILT